MKKSLLFSLFFITTLSLFVGCQSKVKDPTAKAEVVTDGKISEEVTIGSKIDSFTLKDQFDKNQTLKSDTKKLILVFKKATGHLVKEYFNKKPVDFMEKNHIQMIADVSGMPSIILTMFALPDLKKHKYPIMLIKDEKLSKKFGNKKYSEKIWIVTLDNFVVKNVTFVTNEKDFDREIK